MKIILLNYVLLFVSLTFACSNGAAFQNDDSKVKNSNSGEFKKDDKKTDALQKQIGQIASEAKGRVGVKAEILETGESVSLNPSEHFPMQSVYKFPIGMAVLKQVDEGKLKLEQSVKIEKNDFVSPGQHSPIRDKYPNGVELSVNEILRLAVSESDGTASDVLLKLVGGAQSVQSYLAELGVTEVIVANTEKEFGQDRNVQYRNWASPDGAVKLLRAFYERRGLSEQSQLLLLKFMTESPTGPKRLKGFLPTGTIVAHKTGTSGTYKGVTAATNDIGIITLPNGQHLAIAVFVSDSQADEKTREEVIAKIAKAVWDEWGK